MITRDEWLTALDAAREPADADALTVQELADLTGISERSMRRRLRERLMSGTVQQTWKYIKTAQSSRVRVTAYRLCKPAKKGKAA